MVNYFCYYLDLIFMGHCKNVRETNSNKTGTCMCCLKMLIYPYLSWKKPKHSIRNSSPNWIQRPGSLCFSSLAESCVSAEVNGTLGVAVNYAKSLLEELCIRWTLLSIVCTNSLCCDWLAQVSVGLCTWTKHYVGSPGYVCISQNSQCSSLKHSKILYPPFTAAQLSLSGPRDPIWGSLILCWFSLMS